MTTGRGASTLAILGGGKTVTRDPGDLFSWPRVTREDEEAVLDVLRRGAMSGNDVTKEFERETAAFFGVDHALAFCNGTAAILGAMWACGVRRGDEIIGPSLTYWASVMPAYSLGATVVFADVEPHTICIDPKDVEHRVTDRTKVIVATHNYSHPCDMDPLMDIARRRGLRVIEDVSHAQGGLYRGRMLGTIGDVGCMSLMSGKSLAIGEGGMLVTDDRAIWERAIAFGFYELAGGSRWTGPGGNVTDPELARFAGVPLGGCKHRINQTCSAMGRVQLRRYQERIEEIQRAMNLFWDELEGAPGIRAHRVEKGRGSTMGGWYAPIGLYVPEKLGGLPVGRFCEAVNAEAAGGALTSPGANFPLHLHPFFREADVYGDGRPTARGASSDGPAGEGSLPVSESVPERVFKIPWFKRHDPERIRPYARAFRKVAEMASEIPAG